MSGKRMFLSKYFPLSHDTILVDDHKKWENGLMCLLTPATKESQLPLFQPAIYT